MLIQIIVYYSYIKINIYFQKAVEEEYRNWTSMTNENDIIAHFSVPTAQPLFLCLLWKMIIETDRINPIAYKYDEINIFILLF